MVHDLQMGHVPVRYLRKMLVAIICPFGKNRFGWAELWKKPSTISFTCCSFKGVANQSPLFSSTNRYGNLGHLWVVDGCQSPGTLKVKRNGTQVMSTLKSPVEHHDGIHHRSRKIWPTRDQEQPDFIETIEMSSCCDSSILGLAMSFYAKNVVADGWNPIYQPSQFWKHLPPKIRSKSSRLNLTPANTG